MKIEILCTGDEILSGKTVNTNHSFMARRLVENGFEVYWGTVVGDDRDSLVHAFEMASQRADAIIVNGGLGPTVDDLSQEVAAQTAGVELELNQGWLDRISEWYQSRGRVMPENNHKQAMLPAGSEFIDNPIGTACGFAIDINGARFFFTPGVPREMRRMLNEQIVPRLQNLRGYHLTTRVKRFHTFGIGESRADRLLDGIEEMALDGSVKLGFQSHYPQLETKLTLQGRSEQEIDNKLRPIETAMREKLGNFVIAEDNQTIEGSVLDALEDVKGCVSIMEMNTAGMITTRLMSDPDHVDRVKSSLVSWDPDVLSGFVGREAGQGVSTLHAGELAASILQEEGVTHALVVLTERKIKGNKDSSESSSIIHIVVADGLRRESRQAELPGSPDWIQTGSTELALDCLRRFLYGLPVQERIDFEQH